MTQTATFPYTRDAAGVFTICPTPSDAEGTLDLKSIATLVKFPITAGVADLAVPSFLDEAHKISGPERHVTVRTFVPATSGRLPEWVDVRTLGPAGAMEQAREAQALGAAAVFVAPLEKAGDKGLYDYQKTVARSVDIPVVIQDFPDSFETEIGAELVVERSTSAAVLIFLILFLTPTLLHLIESGP